MSDRTRILAVDDDEQSLRVTARVLEQSGYVVRTATTGQQCMESMANEQPDVLLLDVVLPDANGIDLCRSIKCDTHFAETFVVLFSSRLTESEYRIKGLESGADGYIVRPIPNRELAARIESLDRIRRKQLLAKAELQEQLLEEARQDALTGVYNRRFLNQLIAQESDRATRYDHPVGLLMIDVDRFKTINDVHGHQTGDLVLKEIAETLVSSLRSSDIVIRYGGDEFLVVLTETGSDPEEVGTRIQAAVEANETLRDVLGAGISVPVGSVSWNPRSGGQLAAALSEADRRMYEDKRSGS